MSATLLFASVEPEADFLSEDYQPTTSWADIVEEELGEPEAFDWDAWIPWGDDDVPEEVNPVPVPPPAVQKRVKTRELCFYFVFNHLQR